MSEASSEKPVLKVIDSSATPEEVAALVAVFSALGAPAPAPRKPRSLWAAPQPRQQLHAGPGAWRASAMPH